MKNKFILSTAVVLFILGIYNSSFAYDTSIKTVGSSIPASTGSNPGTSGGVVSNSSSGSTGYGGAAPGR